MNQNWVKIAPKKIAHDNSYVQPPKTCKIKKDCIFTSLKCKIENEQRERNVHTIEKSRHRSRETLAQECFNIQFSIGGPISKQSDWFSKSVDFWTE